MRGLQPFMAVRLPELSRAGKPPAWKISLSPIATHGPHGEGAKDRAAMEVQQRAVAVVVRRAACRA